MNPIIEMPPNLWLLPEESERVLSATADALDADAKNYRTDPKEETALGACGRARFVWETAEGMSLCDTAIESKPLKRAIDAIDNCVTAINQGTLPGDASPEMRQHLQKICAAMADRRDDLAVLLKHGRAAFFERLRDRRRMKE